MTALTHSLIAPVRAPARAPVASAPSARAAATASLRPACAPRVAAPVRAARLARASTVRVAAAKGYKVALLGAAGGIGQPLGLLLKVSCEGGRGRRKANFMPPTVARVRVLGKGAGLRGVGGATVGAGECFLAPAVDSFRPPNAPPFAFLPPYRCSPTSPSCPCTTLPTSRAWRPTCRTATRRCR